MAAKMAAQNLIPLYLSSIFKCKDEWSGYSYEIEDVQFKYEEINSIQFPLRMKEELRYIWSEFSAAILTAMLWNC